MPTIRFAPPLVTSRIVRPSGDAAPPGVVPTSGTSPEAIPAGRIAFATNILVAHTNPTINTAAFPSRFATSLYEQSLTKAATVAGDVSIATGTPTAAELAAIRATLPTVLSISAEATARWSQARWINVRGVFTASRSWTLTGLNRAIADALTNVIAWNETSVRRSLSPITIPEDGDLTALYNALTASNACGGRRAYGDVFAAACTRWGAVPVQQPTPTPVAPTPATPPAPVTTVRPSTTPSTTRPATPAASTTLPTATVEARLDAAMREERYENALTLLDELEYTRGVTLRSQWARAQINYFLARYGGAVTAAQTCLAAAARSTEAYAGDARTDCQRVLDRAQAALRPAPVPVPTPTPLPDVRPEGQMQPGTVIPPAPPAASSNAPIVIGAVVAAGIIVALVASKKR